MLGILNMDAMKRRIARVHRFVLSSGSPEIQCLLKNDAGNRRRKTGSLKRNHFSFNGYEAEVDDDLYSQIVILPAYSKYFRHERFRRRSAPLYQWENFNQDECFDLVEFEVKEEKEEEKEIPRVMKPPTDMIRESWNRFSLDSKHKDGLKSEKNDTVDHSILNGRERSAEKLERKLSYPIEPDIKVKSVLDTRVNRSPGIVYKNHAYKVTGKAVNDTTGNHSSSVESMQSKWAAGGSCVNGISWNRMDKRKSSLSEISSWRSQIRSSFIESKMESLRSVGRLIATSVPEPVKEIQIPAKLESTAISENPGNENSPSMEQQASDTTVQKVQEASQITTMPNSVQAEEVVKIESVNNGVKRTSISRKEDGVVKPSKVVTFSSDTKTDSPVKPRNKERFKQSQMKSLEDWTCLPDLKTAKAKPDVTPMETTSLVPEYFLAPRCNEIVKSSVEVKKSKSSNPNSYCVLPAIRVFGVDNLELLLRRSLTSGDKPSRYSMTESTSATSSSSSVLSASCKRSSSAERLHQRTPELPLKSGKFEMFTSNRNLFSDLDRKPKHKAINDRDLLQVEMFYRSHKTEVYVCRCSTILYFGSVRKHSTYSLHGSETEHGISTSEESSEDNWNPVKSGILLLVLDSGESRRHRRLYIALAEVGTGFTLWKDSVDYLTNYCNFSSIFHTMRLSHNHKKLAGFLFSDNLAASEFYQTLCSVSSNREDTLLNLSEFGRKQRSVEFNSAGKSQTEPGCGKGARGKNSAVSKIEISGPCCFTHVTKLDKRDDAIWQQDDQFEADPNRMVSLKCIDFTHKQKPLQSILRKS